MMLNGSKNCTRDLDKEDLRNRFSVKLRFQDLLDNFSDCFPKDLMFFLLEVYAVNVTRPDHLRSINEFTSIFLRYCTVVL